MIAPKLKDWTLDILGKRYAVKWEPLKKLYGKCESPLCILRVNPEYHVDQQKDALLHESIHALDHEATIGLTEKQVRRLGTTLLHYMRSNPEVIRWMCERD